MLPGCWVSMGQKGVKTTWPASCSSRGRGWASPNSSLWSSWLHAAPWLLHPLTVVLNPQPLWFYICKKNPPGSYTNRKRWEPASAGWGAGCGERTRLFSQTLKSSWFCPHPQHIHMRAHTHAHTQPCTSFYTSFCRRWCFWGAVQARGPCFSSSLHLHTHLHITLLCKLLD